MARIRKGLVAALGVALMGGLVACGDDVSTESQVQAMGAAETPAATAEATPALDGAGTNQTPVIKSVKLNPEAPITGMPLTAVVDSHDADGDFLRFTFSWYRNGQLVSESGKASITFPELAKSDRIEVQVVATDGKAESGMVSARSRAGNRVPYLTNLYITPDNQLIRRGEVLIAHPEGNDADNDSLRFQYAWYANGRPVGDERSFDTSDLKRGDVVYVEVVANDGQLDSPPRQSLEIEMSNSPPKITQLPQVQFDDGQLRYAFQAEDADGDRNLRFWVENGPDGMQMDSLSGELTWSPRADQAGVHPVQVGVKDGLGEGTKFEFNVTVSAAAPPANTP